MFEPFPNNYVWNLSVNIALALGGAIGEIECANEQIRKVAREGADAGTEAFFKAWGAMADRLVALGEEAEAAGHKLSASEKYLRAAIYYMSAERMQSRDYAPRVRMYQTMLETMARGVSTGALDWTRVEIPFGNSSFPGIYIPGIGRGPRPTIVFCNGLDSTKEMIALALRKTFAKRGVAVLGIDQPGTGEALRLRGLHAIPQCERWAAAALDHLSGLEDVDASRFGIIGWSLGGFYAPRAACYEKRLKLCVAWGANHNWGEVQRRRLEREGENPVPHYWDHVMWVWGKKSMDEFMALMPEVSLAGHLQHLNAPFLVAHGSKDRQISVDYAHQSYDEAVNSPKRELKIFGEREGGVEHSSADNMEPARSYIADWVVDRFGEMT